MSNKISSQKSVARSQEKTIDILAFPGKNHWKMERITISLKGWREKAKFFARYWAGLFYRAGVCFRNERIAFQANTLAYRTLLNIVPLLLFVFSLFALFKQMVGIDLDERLNSILSQYILPQSNVGQLIVDQVRQFYENAKQSSYLSLVLLLITSIFLFNAIDGSINLTFKVERQRNFFQRLVLFTAILVWGTTLVGLSIYLTAKIQFQPLLARFSESTIIQEIAIKSFMDRVLILLQHLGTYMLSFTLVFFSLYFLYKVFPNTQVETRASFLGAFVAALFWELSKWGFSFFTAHMLYSREKIYGSLAVFLLFLIWVHLVWLIVLFGAELAYVYQHYRFEAQAQPMKRTPVNRLWLSFQIFLELGTRFLKGEDALTLKELGQKFSVGLPELKSVIKCLQDANLLIACACPDRRGEEKYQPARELDQIYFNQLVRAVDPNWNFDQIKINTGSDAKLQSENQYLHKLFQKLGSEVDEFLSQKSLKEILLEDLVSVSQEGNNAEK